MRYPFTVNANLLDTALLISMENPNIKLEIIQDDENSNVVYVGVSSTYYTLYIYDKFPNNNLLKEIREHCNGVRYVIPLDQDKFSEIYSIIKNILSSAACLKILRNITVSSSPRDINVVYDDDVKITYSSDNLKIRITGFVEKKFVYQFSIEDEYENYFSSVIRVSLQMYNNIEDARECITNVIKHIVIPTNMKLSVWN